MLGSISVELLPTDDPGTVAPSAGRHEPVTASPLLRDRGAGLVEAATISAAAELVAAQLAPIESHEGLASSFSREADPSDPDVQAGYACAWAELGMRLCLGTTRRARHRATIPTARRRPRGPG